jgi:hypothetical protein
MGTDNLEIRLDKEECSCAPTPRIRLFGIRSLQGPEKVWKIKEINVS